MVQIKKLRFAFAGRFFYLSGEKSEAAIWYSLGERKGDVLMITHKLHLDVSKDGVQGNIVLVKGERASRDISFTLSNGKNTVELGEDYSAAFRGIKPDGNELFNSCVVYTENGVYPNTVRYHVTEQTVTAAGTFTARLLIWNREGEVLWSPEFSVTVKEHSSLDSDVESQSEFTALIDAAVQAQNAAKQTENVAAETKKEVGEWLEKRDADLEEHVADRGNPHGVTAKQLGLERVDNTSDEEKPLSLAARKAIEECVKTSEKTSGAYIYRILDGQNGVVGYSGQVQEHSIAQRIFGGRLRVGEPKEDSDAVTKKYADETKVGKVGDQVIEGGLSISGDLLVGGDTFAKQIESLEVADAVIIANSDGVPLSELSGYVIRVNGDSAYAIVYDPTDDCVKIGLGVYDSNTKVFTFSEGEAQVLATRGAIADGHVPVWNDAKKTFEDSGKSADKIVERGSDIPNGEIPVLKDGKLIGSGKTASSFASKDSAQMVANALKGSASGTAVALKDVSPLDHILGVKVSSENLIPYPYNQTTKTINGITFTDNGDGSITVNGTATDKATFTIFYATSNLTPEIKSPFVLSGTPTGGSGESYSLQLSYKNSQGGYGYVIDTGSGKTCTAADFIEVSGIYIVIRKDTVMDNLTFYPKVAKGTTITPHTPYIADIAAVKVRAQGKNLLDFSPIIGEKVEVNGASIICNADGSITASGTPKGYIALTTFRIDTPKNVDLTLSISGTYTNLQGTISIYNDKNEQINALSVQDNYKTVSFKVGDDAAYVSLSIKRKANDVEMSGTAYFQLEPGTTATEHEPYKEPIEYTVSPDGTVDGVKSIAPATTLTTDTEGVLIEVEYNKDINKAFAELQQAIISLGGNV